MSSSLKNILYVSVPSSLIFLFFLEFFIFRFLIPASDIPNATYDDINDIVKYESYQKGIIRSGPLSERKSRFNINNSGWNSTINYNANKISTKRIAIIGDSYVEAFSVDVDKAFPSILQKELDTSSNTEVYSFGISGAPLSQYYHMLKYVWKDYTPDIIILNLVHNDFDESISNIFRRPYFHQYQKNNENSYVLTEQEPFIPNKINRTLKKSAIVRYIFKNLKISSLNILKIRLSKLLLLKNTYNENDKSFKHEKDIYNLLRNNQKIGYSDSIYNYYNEIDNITSHIFKKIKEFSKKNNIKILICIDADRYFIYTGKNPKHSSIYMLNDISIKNANKFSIPILDLTDSFLNDYLDNKREFEWNDDKHWNNYGNQIVGKAIYKKINSLQWLNKH